MTEPDAARDSESSPASVPASDSTPAVELVPPSLVSTYQAHLEPQVEPEPASLESDPAPAPEPVTPTSPTVIKRRQRRNLEQQQFEREAAEYTARAKLEADLCAQRLAYPAPPPTRRGGHQPKSAVMPA